MENGHTDRDLERQRREKYLRSDMADRYHNRFTGPGIRNFAARQIARRERAIVGRLLDERPASSVLDLAAGTGKLAPVFQHRNLSVTAADLSPVMLEYCKDEYTKLSYSDVDYVVVDAAEASSLGPHDIVVCLRLMQRLPEETRRKVLAEISNITSHVIISFGIPTRMQRIRRDILRINYDRSWRMPWTQVHDEVGEHFEIARRVPVFRGLSLEWILLLDSKSK